MFNFPLSDKEKKKSIIMQKLVNSKIQRAAEGNSFHASLITQEGTDSLPKY